jgi:hypothetical protein
MSVEPMSVATDLDVDTYKVTDSFFGKPYIDVDEWQESPAPHRHVHGGFEGTDTRFTFYFPPAEAYHGRFIQPLEGAHAGHEDAFGGPMGEMLGGLGMATRLGAYMVESNSGHIGDELDAKAGEDPTIYGHRASAETGRFSKHVAAQVYGTTPGHGYVWGGSGGGRRSPLCLEYGPDVWDGALPFMGGGDIADHGTTERIRGAGGIYMFSSMFNVQRVLGSKLEGVVDALAPGGSGDPFAGLTTHEREELTNLWRLGYPRGDEAMILEPMGQMWLWTAMADSIQADDAEYFDAFWTKPGYIGHDDPQVVADDVIDAKTTVSRLITPKILAEDPAFAGPEYARLRQLAFMFAGMRGGMDAVVAIEVRGLGDGYRLGAGVLFNSGDAAGRQLYCMSGVGDVFFCSGAGEAANLGLTGVEAGDEVHINNRPFLALCYAYRHHLFPSEEWDFLRVDGHPLYPQHEPPLMSPMMGVAYSGKFEGKLLWIHHTHDASLWPPRGLDYRTAIERSQPEAMKDRFRQQWTENAEHVPPMMLSPLGNRSASSWLIDYGPVIEQGIKDLMTWVEEGTPPPNTNFEYHDGRITLPETAAERGGIQPVVNVTANGGDRADVKTGKPVTLEVVAEVPPNAGTIIAVEWDFDGSATFPFSQEVDGKDTSVKLSTTHAYDEPGTYFATARVISHREGDVAATSRRIPNLAAARVVVT